MDARVMEGVIGDAEARLKAVREYGQGQAAKAAALDACVTHLTAKLKKVQDLLDWLPITTPELIRLRNANKITFDKQVNSITTCLIQLRECFERDAATESK